MRVAIANPELKLPLLTEIAVLRDGLGQKPLAFAARLRAFTESPQDDPTREELERLAADLGSFEELAAAYELKRPDWLLAAAARAYLLQPESMATANNYAAALLLNRERSEEAIKLTLQLLDRFPQSMAAKINHGLALLLNRRTLEAEALLKAIDPAKLNGVEAASLYLGLFEVCFNEQQYDQARLLCDRINKKSLFPNQIKWLDESCRQIAERQAAQ